MRIVAFDTETALIRPAHQAPHMVCLTWQECIDKKIQEARIVHWKDAESIIRSWLDDPQTVLVGHNVAYDMAVIFETFPELGSRIHWAYANDRVTDTMIRQQLLDIAAGIYRGAVDKKGKKKSIRYDLESTARRVAAFEIRKDLWRYAYENFLEVSLVDWPERARELQEIAKLKREQVVTAANAATRKPDRKKLDEEAKKLEEFIASPAERVSEYAVDDAKATMLVHLNQEKHAERFLKDQFRQARAAFALHLESCWGMCVDGAGAEKLREIIAAERDGLDQELIDEGLIRPDGTRDTKTAKRRMVAVCKEEGLTIIRTDAHFDKKGNVACEVGDDCEEHVCLDAEACELCGDALLMAYAERTTLTKQLTNDIPMLQSGAIYPLHTKYGMAATGRTTSSKPNLQNQSKRPGFRECFIPRPGMVFWQVDYPTLELFCFAQCCKVWLGYSTLGDALIEGKDVHMMVAATILKKDYEWCMANAEHPEVEKARQLAKPANFGFPGGMGAPTFVYSTRKQVIANNEDGLEAWARLGLDEDRAKLLKKEWQDSWKEAKPWLQLAGTRCNNEDNRSQIESLFTKRWRGGASFCATANNGFQALGSDISKLAAWKLAEAQYFLEDHILFGTRTNAMVHDEFIGECPDDDRAHDIANAVADIMCEAANTYLPDVFMPRKKLKPTLMRVWSKKAKPTFDEAGRLIPWAA